MAMFHLMSLLGQEKGMILAGRGGRSGSSRSKLLKITPSDPSELDRIDEGPLSLA